MTEPTIQPALTADEMVDRLVRAATHLYSANGSRTPDAHAALVREFADARSAIVDAIGRARDYPARLGAPLGAVVAVGPDSITVETTPEQRARLDALLPPEAP